MRCFLYFVLSITVKGFKFDSFFHRNRNLRLNSQIIKPSEYLREGMPWSPLGKTDMLVSKACIGTIMWGGQVSERTASDMMTVAYEEFGVNFIDTSELYPMPNKEEWYGESERIVGRWLKTVDRSSIIVSTKMAGYCEYLPFARKGHGKGTRVTREQIRESVEGSLKRLDTDYIDLFQIEWPDRYIPVHADKFFEIHESRQDMIGFQEQADAIKELVKEGKIRHFGLSNETPYGLLKFKEAFKSNKGSKKLITSNIKDDEVTVSSVQNAYNLIERNDFETSMLEACHYTNTSLLAHTPLAGGALSMKYHFKKEQENAGDVHESLDFSKEDSDQYRLNLFPGFTVRYKRPQALTAMSAYREIGKEFDLSGVQLALSWCYSRPFVKSTIIAATTVNQLRDNLMAMNCPMTLEMEEKIFNIYVNEHRDPTAGDSWINEDDTLTKDMMSKLFDENER